MKTDSLKVAIESKLVIETNELIAENIMLKKANKTILKQKERLQEIFNYYLVWIKLSDRLPDIGKEVLVHYKNGDVDVCVRLIDDIGEQHFCDGIDYIDDSFVTHWIPLPPKPEK